MIVLITGASHTGKTLLAQRILEKKLWPYLSMDHLKMGLIRSRQTALTVFDDEQLTEYLWPIVREMIRTALENGQNLIVEGCYVPFDWAADFSQEERKQIEFCCLVMSESYIRTHFSSIARHANAIEQRRQEELNLEEVIADNAAWHAGAGEYGYPVIWIDQEYPQTLEDYISVQKTTALEKLGCCSGQPAGKTGRQKN